MSTCIRCGGGETVSHGLCKDCRNEIPEPSFEPAHLPIGFYLFSVVMLCMAAGVGGFILTMAFKGFVAEFVR